jgi:hypothetical protein
MRNLMKFSAGEWLRLEPVKHALKQTRNDAWLSFYKRQRPEALGPFLKQAQSFQGKNIALVVAFEQPWALDWMLRMAERNLTDTKILVFDNSRRAEKRLEIEQVCKDRGVCYLALPANPTRHVNRSHGMAMTWIYHNVVRAIQPRLFAFLDHDLIPVQKVALAQRLGEQPFFGFIRVNDRAWNLWAGYCMFDFAYVSKLPLNFLYDFSMNLDTGGRNWDCLYRGHDRDRLRHATSVMGTVTDPLSNSCHPVQIVDVQWLHIGGIGYNDNFRDRAELCEHLAAALDQGVSWSSMLEEGDTK